MWTKLKTLARDVENRQITDLFEAPGRAADFSARFDHFLFEPVRNIPDNHQTFCIDVSQRCASDCESRGFRS